MFIHKNMNYFDYNERNVAFKKQLFDHFYVNPHFFIFNIYFICIIQIKVPSVSSRRQQSKTGAVVAFKSFRADPLTQV